jgi:hypothetical protein
VLTVTSTGSRYGTKLRCLSGIVHCSGKAAPFQGTVLQLHTDGHEALAAKLEPATVSGGNAGGLAVTFMPRP